MKFLGKPIEATDLQALLAIGPEPAFDRCTTDFLHECFRQTNARASLDSLLDLRCLGLEVPWSYRAVFKTRSLARTDDGTILPAEHHEFLIRFPRDYLRRVNRYELLMYYRPTQPSIWHPNICPLSGATCLLCYAGQTPLEIVESIHDLLRFRIVDYRETNSLNPAACSDARNLAGRPTDDRPLFGSKLDLTWRKENSTV